MEEEIKWVITCLIMLLPVVYPVMTSREPRPGKTKPGKDRHGKLDQTNCGRPVQADPVLGRLEPPQATTPEPAPQTTWGLRLHAPVDRPLIERTLHLLSEIERFVQPVTGGKVLLTATSMARIQEAELPALIAAKEQALIERWLLSEQVGVAYYLENLLAAPFPPARHETLEDLGLVALRQAFAAREVSEAIHRLRRAIGPLD